MTTRLDPLSTLGPGGRVATLLDGYEVRDEQLRMAKAVSEAIESGTHLMVEAGTGVGKSFAYLVPAILAAAELGKRVMVSTRTKNLQKQLIDKDIPFLRRAMPQDFRAALVMGRSNFVGLRRLDAALARTKLSPPGHAELNQLKAIGEWSHDTKDGSREDLNFRLLESVWEAVQSDTGNCLKQSCPRHHECFFFQMARRSWSANVLVVNHALYMSDLALRAQGYSLLPDHDVIIFDEAHTLANVAANHLGLRVASGAIANLLNALFNERSRSGLLVYHRLDEAQSQARRALAATDAFFDAASEWLDRHESPNGRVRNPISLPGGDSLVEELRKLASAIDRGFEGIALPEQKIELEAARTRCRTFATNLASWLKQDQAGGVYWIEVERDRTKGRTVLLAHALLELGPILRRELFERVPTCVLTSGTLSVGNPPSFDFSRKRLGLNEEIKTLQLGSPFDYRRQVTMYVARNLPEPTQDREGAEQAAIEAIPHFVSKTQGKALVLFTSHKMMAAATLHVEPQLRQMGITLLSQSSGQSTSKLLESFKADVDSVLFGTDSFWQGVDVPGPALSNVIITRLPFSYPSHPILEARFEEIEARGGNRFEEYQLPDAVLKFKQGVGRLIRSKTDYGMIVILDPRVLSKSYGSIFLQSVPSCPRVVV